MYLALTPQNATHATPSAGKVTLQFRDDIPESYFTDIFSKNQ
jgi:hypothetical protein